MKTKYVVSLAALVALAGCAAPKPQSRTKDVPPAPQTQERVVNRNPDNKPKATLQDAVPDEISPTAVADDFDKARFVNYRGKTVTWRGKVDTESEPTANFVVVVLSEQGADGAPCNYVAAVKMFAPLNSGPPKGGEVLVRGAVEDIFTEAWWEQGSSLPGRLINRPENNDLPPLTKGSDGKAHRTVCFRLRDGRLLLTK